MTALDNSTHSIVVISCLQFTNRQRFSQEYIYVNKWLCTGRFKLVVDVNYHKNLASFLFSAENEISGKQHQVEIKAYPFRALVVNNED